MTIAACYLSMEGIVIGSDSTTTIRVQGPSGSWESHHFDFAQKIFEVGQHSQIGVAIWGMGSFTATSYRTMIAEIGDESASGASKTVEEVARSLGTKVWEAFRSVFPQSDIDAIREISRKVTGERTPEEQGRLDDFGTVGGGFCVAGCEGPARTPRAYEVRFDLLGGVSNPDPLQPYQPRFWGAPNMVNRLIYGVDTEFLDRIMASGKWTDTVEELIKVASPGFLKQPNLPLREAIDWVYASIFATIKAFKFSQFQPICGGPVELAVISTDRPFRWVKHKAFDAAI